MRKSVFALVMLLALASTARAEVGLGVFLGEPSGLDIKVGLSPRSAVDIVIGASSYRDNRTDYAHVTWLLTPFVARGRSVLVPFRLGIGGAIYGVVDNNVFGAVRVPFEIGFRFRRTPIEVYGEIAIVGVFRDDDNSFIDFNVDGGIGIRFYF